MPDFKAQTCCFTGHRNIAPGDGQKIITRVKCIEQDLMAKGVVHFGVGGAVGFDMLVAEYLCFFHGTNLPRLEEDQYHICYSLARLDGAME